MPPLRVATPHTPSATSSFASVATARWSAAPAPTRTTGRPAQRFTSFRATDDVVGRRAICASRAISLPLGDCPTTPAPTVAGVVALSGDAAPDAAAAATTEAEMAASSAVYGRLRAPG